MEFKPDYSRVQKFAWNNPSLKFHFAIPTAEKLLPLTIELPEDKEEVLDSICKEFKIEDRAYVTAIYWCTYWIDPEEQVNVRNKGYVSSTDVYKFADLEWINQNMNQEKFRLFDYFQLHDSKVFDHCSLTLKAKGIKPIRIDYQPLAEMIIKEVRKSIQRDPLFNETVIERNRKLNFPGKKQSNLNSYRGSWCKVILDIFGPLINSGEISRSDVLFLSAKLLHVNGHSFRSKSGDVKNLMEEKFPKDDVIKDIESLIKTKIKNK